MTGDDVTQIISFIFSVALVLLFLYFALYIVLYKNIQYVHRHKNGSLIHYFFAVVAGVLYYLYRVVDSSPNKEEMVNRYIANKSFDIMFDRLL